VEVVTRADPERPGGRRFGALVHGILAAVDLNATPEEISAMARAHGRLVGATEAEIEAAVPTVVAALAHPIMRRAASVAPAIYAARRRSFCAGKTKRSCKVWSTWPFERRRRISNGP
jgi:hypothetical protein